MALQDRPPASGERRKNAELCLGNAEKYYLELGENLEFVWKNEKLGPATVKCLQPCLRNFYTRYSGPGNIFAQRRELTQKDAHIRTLCFKFRHITDLLKMEGHGRCYQLFFPPSDLEHADLDLDRFYSTSCVFESRNRAPKFVGPAQIKLLKAFHAIILDELADAVQVWS